MVGKGGIEKKITDAQGHVPNLFPAHLRQGQAAQLQADSSAQAGRAHKVFVYRGGDAQAVGYRYPVAHQRGQRQGLATYQMPVTAFDAVK
jgi:hypothetical protein